MVATVATFFDFAGVNGTPGTQQDTSGLAPVNVRFKTADDSTIDANDLIPIPGAGTNYSFWKHLYMRVTGGTFTQINNVKFFTDGTNFGTGIVTSVGDELPVNNSGSQAGYVVATGTVGTTGTEMVAGHAGITGKTDAFSFTSGAPKTITISEAGGILDASGERTDYLVAQMAVDNTASPGDLADETWTFQYDEI